MTTAMLSVQNKIGRPVSVAHQSSLERMPSIAILSTFPPTQCGLATFASALAEGLQAVGVDSLGVIDVSEGSMRSSDQRVIAHVAPGSVKDRLDAARHINSYDYLLIQHEFGIFGGTDGDEVLTLLDDVYVPVIVTLHTVPLFPSDGQRRVLEALAQRADVLIAMSNAARERFINGYDIDVDKVVTIPHGATVPLFVPMTTDEPVSLLTWGLLGPGKGLEWVIDALAMTPELRGQVTYTIAGQTHPKVLLREGEKYRNMLKRRAELLGISEMVRFDDEYRSLPSLMELIQQSHCVVLPYDSHDQVTSGVLVDAVVAGRPVIATQFPHAVELLSQGAGITVPHKDSVALAHAIRKIATEPETLSSMMNATIPIAEEHSWVSVAARYASVALAISEKNLV
jgi:glycosyltransferase involved in cell wall biosynthesis